jgi:(1->4)-alpha-D-glucan 1-alpha-D-glucosylmutase
MTITQQVAMLLDKAVAAVEARRRLPEATYRLQFHAGFTFAQARALVPYLHDLGITDCYASPYLKARQGSQHGYDISDHRVLNPELGTDEDYAAFVQALQDHGMVQILDIVPNHMGVGCNDNVWWNDVLENGPSSPYAKFFDIDWHPVITALHLKVLLPVLGDPYGKVLESQQLSLSYEAGAFLVNYFDHRFPIAPETSLKILRHRLEELEQTLGTTSAEFIEYQSILTALSHLPPRSTTNPQRIAERQREKEVIKRRLAALVDACGPVHQFLQLNLVIFNGRAGDLHSFDLLDDLLNDQAYRLAYWRVAADEINYRRFFDINELAALSQEDPETFAATHELLLRLLAEGKVNSLRVDHADGLYDPKQYLQRLQRSYVRELARQAANALPDFHAEQWPELEGPLLEAIDQAARKGKDVPLHRPLYVVVEKILERDEALPDDWPVYGTTGYEFLAALNGLFVDSTQAPVFSRLYHRWTGMDPSFGEYVYAKKFLILRVALASELHMLANQLEQLAEKNRWSRDFTIHSLRHALREIIACFPVYRSYTDADGVHLRDRLYVETAVARAAQKNPVLSASLFAFVGDMLLLRDPEARGDADRAEQRRFVGKFQQLTGPVMAKGLEDTAFYVYNRLVSLNEVGGDPGEFGTSPAAFHRHNQERQRNWPHGLSATSTHDTKRSEDVRARLNVLSEMPREWQKCLGRWRRLNRRHRVDLGPLTAPDANDEYLYYQTLIGAWPLGESTAASRADFVRRLQQYMEKATHEAKVHTSWVNPNPAYDEAVRRFVARTLDDKLSPRFLKDFRAFQQRISYFALFNSLSHTLLKIAAPGVPDFYQGTELWDFSLVDPDNRRPVDYELRRQWLHELTGRLSDGASLMNLARELMQTRVDGRVKMFITRQALHCRRGHPGLFSAGEYVPLEASGRQAEQVFAFLRRHDGLWAIAAAPRLVTKLFAYPTDLPIGGAVWQDTVLYLPGIGPNQRCRNIFTGEILTTCDKGARAGLAVADVFANFSVALLLVEP